MNTEHSTEAIYNRRSARRYSYNIPVECNGLPGLVLNISLTGMRFVSNTPVPVGALPKLKLTFEEESIDLVAETVWTQSHRWGSLVGATFQPTPELAKLPTLLSNCAKIKSYQP